MRRKRRNEIRMTANGHRMLKKARVAQFCIRYLASCKGVSLSTKLPSSLNNTSNESDVLFSKAAHHFILRTVLESELCTLPVHNPPQPILLYVPHIRVIESFISVARLIASEHYLGRECFIGSDLPRKNSRPLRHATSHGGSDSRLQALT